MRTALRRPRRQQMTRAPPHLRWRRRDLSRREPWPPLAEPLTPLAEPLTPLAEPVWTRQLAVDAEFFPHGRQRRQSRAPAGGSPRQRRGRGSANIESLRRGAAPCAPPAATATGCAAAWCLAAEGRNGSAEARLNRRRGAEQTSLPRARATTGAAGRRRHEAPRGRRGGRPRHRRRRRHHCLRRSRECGAREARRRDRPHGRRRRRRRPLHPFEKAAHSRRRDCRGRRCAVRGPPRRAPRRGARGPSRPRSPRGGRRHRRLLGAAVATASACT